MLFPRLQGGAAHRHSTTASDFYITNAPEHYKRSDVIYFCCHRQSKPLRQSWGSRSPHINVDITFQATILILAWQHCSTLSDL